MRISLHWIFFVAFPQRPGRLDRSNTREEQIYFSVTLKSAKPVSPDDERRILGVGGGYSPVITRVKVDSKKNTVTTYCKGKCPEEVIEKFKKRSHDEFGVILD